MSAWASCFDESMSKWLAQFTCLGFMCIPCKPWPFGNEYQTICCAISGILYGAELVEGKDEPHSSGFCVLQGLIELRKKGVFASALIKKKETVLAEVHPWQYNHSPL